ncbi:deoxyribonuclease-2-beta isoform X2 [Electrophorus electricus]|uniref:deoxyribonuclease-2-beta isoform X2 n=1 Tax=Electrophorus electricus TaxID=8005 RepID=UPI000F0A8397|nr:deoxyribonuclease-2-beta isoform X2 [Electrophorus electricus]
MFSVWSFCLILIQVFIFGSLCEADLSCLDEEGQPVDWFIVYKLPKYTKGVVGSGVDYMYLDPSLLSWQLSTHVVNTSKGAIGSTLSQLYHRYELNSSAYMIYNDAPPVLKYLNNYGHTKGVLLFDESQGFWLMHSVPHFPPFPEMGYGFPSTGKLFGQMFHCTTYSYREFQKISAYYTDMAAMAQLCAGEMPVVSPSRKLEKLKSVQGETFLSFAKSHSYVDDIYAGWVAQTLRTDVLVETWQREPHHLPSNCSLPYHVMNIRSISLPGPVIFNSYEDHSKWCVSLEYKAQWACVGDLNREIGQAWRGGGLVCSPNPGVYRAFRQAVAWYKSC